RSKRPTPRRSGKIRCARRRTLPEIAQVLSDRTSLHADAIHADGEDFPATGCNPETDGTATPIPPIGFRPGRHHPIQLKRPPSPTSRWGGVHRALLGFRRRPGLTVIILAVFIVSLRLGLGFRSIQT